MLDASAFGIIVFFAYRNVEAIRLSSLFRTIVADATVYFVMAMIIEALVLFILSLADVCRRRPLSILILLTHSLLGYDESIPNHVRTPPSDWWNLTNPFHLTASIQCEFSWNF